MHVHQQPRLVAVQAYDKHCHTSIVLIWLRVNVWHDFFSSSSFNYFAGLRTDKVRFSPFVQPTLLIGSFNFILIIQI